MLKIRSRFGFSLIELLVVLMIVGLISLSAMFFHKSIFERNQKQALVEQLKLAITYSRNEAKIRGETLILKPRDVNNWAKGYCLMDANQKIIYQWQPDFSGWDISWSGFASKNELRITANPQNSAMNGKFLISNAQNHEVAKLIINRLGRIRIS